MVGLRGETGTSAHILEEYVSALVKLEADKVPNESYILHHAPPVDLEVLRGLFAVAREIRKAVLLYAVLAAKRDVSDTELEECIWKVLDVLLRYEP